MTSRGVPARPVRNWVQVLVVALPPAADPYIAIVSVQEESSCSGSLTSDSAARRILVEPNASVPTPQLLNVSRGKPPPDGR